MKRIVVAFFILFTVAQSYAQQVAPKKIYTMSGIGFAFPTGQTKDVFKAKFSTTLGANIDVGKNNFFLYPQLSFHAYSFFQKDFLLSESPYLTNRTRSTTYFFALALGYRKTVDNLSLYGFGGMGGGNLLVPHIVTSEENKVAMLENHKYKLPLSVLGGGIEYQLGDLAFFAESAWMHSFTKVENRRFNSIPLCIGIKPSIGKLFAKKN